MADQSSDQTSAAATEKKRWQTPKLTEVPYDDTNSDPGGGFDGMFGYDMSYS